ncbi:MAG TPA: hypothetical protein VHU14_05860 [Solirubrobacterales bacterium]|jgi:hypothetical protein|nr:hypothetical protein [Solirubrobacterales bacterium]
MRKRLTLTAAMAVAVAVTVVTAAAATTSPVLNGPDGNTQSIAVNITPQKLSKKAAEPVTLNVATATSTTNPKANNGAPVPAVEAIVDFPKGVTIFNKGYPTCDAGLLQNTSTEAALEACKKAKIGSGVGTADLVVGEKIFPVTTAITAFNGVPAAGKPVILLHTYSQSPIQTTLVLVGTVTNLNKEGYGPRLDVVIPLIAGGQGAITSFQAKIFKTFSYKGKKRSYVSATCLSKKLKSRGQFVFKDGESLTPTLTGKCAQKP